MTKIALLIIVIFYFSTSYAASDTVIKNIQIITYENKFNPEYGYIVISGHKIKNVGKGVYKNSVNNADVIDGKNMFVIPGLIDSHNHIDSILGFDNSTQLKRIDLVNEYRNQLPRSYLYFGYIILIDLSTSDQEIISEFKGQPERPDLFTSGGAITEFNGYPMVFLNEEEKLKKLPNFIMSVENKKTDNIKLKKDHSPEKLVNNILKNIGTFVKVFYEPGFNEQNKFPVPSLNNIKAVIEQSHKKQLPVIMHANSAIAQRFAIKAGADGVAHGLWNWNTGNKTNIMPENIKEILNDIANKKVGYQATIRTMGGLFDLFDENYFSDPNLSKVVPQSLLNWYQTKEGEWFKNEIIEDNDEEKVKNQIKLAYDRALISLGYLAQKEGFLLFASDTPSAPIYSNPPGLNSYLEMKEWLKAGVSLDKILEAATINNAKFFNLNDAYGSIADGKIANILLLKKNPLESIEAYNEIDSVIIHGKIYEREVFSANSKMKHQSSIN